jgi:glutamine amidotransferase
MSRPKIAIIDYGVGNLRSITGALLKGDGEPHIVKGVERGDGYAGIILPGVGAFRSAIANIDPEPLLERVEEGIPVLGICLGLQILFSSSEEGGELIPGLGILKGGVTRIPHAAKLPHIGWNTLSVVRKTPLLEGISDNAFFYFVHSYACLSVDSDCCSAISFYGERFISVASKGQVYGTQFHPEKSGAEGLRILSNFVRMAR